MTSEDVIRPYINNLVKRLNPRLGTRTGGRDGVKRRCRIKGPTRQAVNGGIRGRRWSHTQTLSLFMFRVAL